LHGRVLAVFESPVCAGDERCATCLRRGDGRLRVVAEVDALDRELRGKVAVDDFEEVVVDDGEASGQVVALCRGDAAVRDGCDVRPAAAYDAPARICQTGIDTHDNLRFHLHSFDTNKCSRIEYPFGPRHASECSSGGVFQLGGIIRSGMTL